MTKPWTEHRNAIHDLYKVQGKTLEETIKVMKAEHGFDASIRAYRTKFKTWGWTKYSKQKKKDHRQHTTPSGGASTYQNPSITAVLSSDGASSIMGPTITRTISNSSSGYASSSPDGYGDVVSTLNPTTSTRAYLNRQASLHDEVQSSRQSLQDLRSIASTPSQRKTGDYRWQGHDRPAQQHLQQQQHPLFFRTLPSTDNQNEQHQAPRIDTGDTKLSFLSALITPNSPISSSISSPQRINLIMNGICQLRDVGRLNDCVLLSNGQRLTALELFVQNFDSDGCPDSHVSPEKIYDFCKVCAAFVEQDAETTRIVPHGFAQTISIALMSSEAALRIRGAVLSHQQQLHEQDEGLTFVPWVSVWISACQQGSSRNPAVLNEHLDVLSYWLNEKIDVHRYLKELIPTSKSPEK